jgi:hypothetical protein
MSEVGLILYFVCKIFFFSFTFYQGKQVLSHRASRRSLNQQIVRG